MAELKVAGFVGFGAMAKLMAQCLINKGFDVLAFDPAEHQQELDGIKLFPDAATMTSLVDVIIISVPADAALEDASQGPKGVLKGARKGLLLLNTSTVSVEASKKLAKAASEMGVRFVESPVSGSTPEARDGKLIILAGGEEGDVIFAAPILDAIGQRTIRAGPVGQGLVLKYIVNGIMALSAAALAEGIAYGVASGLEREALIQTLKSLTLISKHDQPKLDMATAKAYPSQFPTELLAKDLGLLLSHASRCGVPMGSTAAAAQLYSLATLKHAKDDYSAVIGVIEELVCKPGNSR